MKRFVKKILNKDSYLYSLLSYLYNWKDKNWQPKSYGDISRLISIYASENKFISFIQVGSNDGISNDPLYPFIKKYSWTGYCIEPVFDNFEKLVQTHEGNSKVNLLNIAVGEDGQLTLYRINPDKAMELNIEIPIWHDQLSSFDKNLVVSDIKGERKFEILDKVTVESKTFLSLIDEYHIKSLDILHIDTEGADWNILSSFPFKNLKPEIIIFEHNHLSLEDYKAAVTFLKSFGYGLVKVKTDSFAYLDKVLFNQELKNSYKIDKKF